MHSSEFIDYSNDTETLTIRDLLSRGFSPYEAYAYLNKLKVQRFFENDNGGKNEDFKRERGIDQFPSRIRSRQVTKKNQKRRGE